MMKLNLIAVMIVTAVLSAGCGQLIIRQPKNESPPPTVSPQNDARSIPQLRTENKDLRAKMAKLEDYHSKWKTAVDNREAEKKDLQRECDRVKKERDYYKKLAKNRND